ncbi:hypothetical protein BDZ89DRAFT_953781, partial [Hymenopellis radicata]
LLRRTRSGKGTLAMSILRFVDPTEGRILIDGIDISKIGVHDLRERLARPFANSAVLKLIIALDSHFARRLFGMHREDLDTFSKSAVISVVVV